MQTLVIAHAAFGHNHFFKNNYLFKQWTDADGILDYLEFAKRYVTHCEERHGRRAVEQTLDAAHALMSHGIDRYPGKKKLDLRAEEKRAGRRRLHEEGTFNDLWRTVPTGPIKSDVLLNVERRQTAARAAAGKSAVLPGEDGAAAGALATRIAAYRAAHRAVFLSAEPDQGHERGHRDLRSLSHHEPPARAGTDDPTAISSNSCSRTPTSCSSPISTIRAISGFNPYALGFAMMQDIERIVTNPDDEDREWFPDIAGTGDAMGVLRDVWANYRDESFISQFHEPAADAALPHVPSARRSGGARRHHGRRHPRRARLSPRCAANWRGNTMSASSMPISKSSTSILPAIAA